MRPEYRGVSSTGIFSPEAATQNFKLTQADKFGQFFAYCREGIWHIWIGFDHILSLLALLLPVVVRREQMQWQSVVAFKPAFWGVIKIVTAITIADSPGVGAGQLVIVTAFLPIVFLLRHTRLYRHIIRFGGSILIAILAVVWLIERIFYMKVLPF